MLSVSCRTRHRRLGDGPSSHFDDLSACRQSYSFLAELPGQGAAALARHCSILAIRNE